MLDDKQQQQRTAVTCIAYNDNVIYLGTPGQVFIYHYNNLDSTFILIQRQKTISQHANIKDIVVLPNTQSLAVLADSVLVFYDLAMHPHPTRRYTNITVITPNLYKLATQKHDSLLAAKQKSVMKLKLTKLDQGSNSLNVLEVQEYAALNGVHSLAWYKQYMYIANSLFMYQSLDLKSNTAEWTDLTHLNPVVPVTKLRQQVRPHLVLVSDKQVLITCQTSDTNSTRPTAIGIVLSPSGEPSVEYPTIQWTSYPQAIAFHYPYVLALVPNTSDPSAPLYLTAHNLLNMSTTPTQSDPIPIRPLGLLTLPTTIQTASGQFKVLARERSALFALTCPLYKDMAHMWLERGLFHQTSVLAERTLPQLDKLHVFAVLAVKAIQVLQWDLALQYCLSAEFNPALLIYLYDPGLCQEMLLDTAVLELQLDTLGTTFKSFKDLITDTTIRSTSNDTEIETQLNQFLFTYLTHTTKAEFLLEYVRLDLMLKLNHTAAQVLTQTQQVCNTVPKKDPAKMLNALSTRLKKSSNAHTYAASLVDLHLGLKFEVLTVWTQLINTNQAPITFSQFADVLETVSDHSAAHMFLHFLLDHDTQCALRVLLVWEPEFDPKSVCKFGASAVLTYYNHLAERLLPLQHESFVAWLVHQCLSHDWTSLYINSVPSVSFIEYLDQNLPKSQLRHFLAKLVWSTSSDQRAMLRNVITDKVFVFEQIVVLEDRVLAVQRLVQQLRDFESASLICQRDKVPFKVVVDEYIKLPNRDDVSSFFMAVAVKNLHEINFDQLVNVLPSTWPLANASAILSHELMQLTRQLRWTTIIKSLERQQNLNTKLANLKLVINESGHSKSAAVVLPTSCAWCEESIDDVNAQVVVRPHNHSRQVFHQPCHNVYLASRTETN